VHFCRNESRAWQEELTKGRCSKAIFVADLSPLGSIWDRKVRLIHKILFLAGLILFVFGLIFIAAGNIVRSHNSPFNLSGDILWATLDFIGLGLLLSGSVASILGLALKKQ